nr:MAG TPA: Putative Holin-like Toxin (Hol-Tox) [Caudoviricetes sp.]
MPPPDTGGGDAMVTYEALFSFCIVIISIIALFQGKKK